MKEKILLAVCALLLAAAACAQTYEVSSHSITIEVDGEGFAKVSEKFFLKFPNSYQMERFLEKSRELGSSLESWKAFDSTIYTHIGSTADVINGIVKPLEKEGKNYYLEISYELSSAIMKKKSETSRMINYALAENVLSEFFSGNLLVIPKGTTIKFVLPKSIEIRERPQPEAVLDGSNVTWSGYKSANAFILEYVYWRQIAPSVEISMLFYSLITSKDLPLILGVLLILALVLYWKKKVIAAKIENYVVEHSDLSKGEHEKEEE